MEGVPNPPSAMVEAGLLIADQLAAWLGHAPMLPLDPEPANP